MIRHSPTAARPPVHVCQCYACARATLPPRAGPLTGPAHYRWAPPARPDSLDDQVRINGAVEDWCLQADAAPPDGRAPWALRISPPLHRCACGGGKPCVEVVHGEIVVSRAVSRTVSRAPGGGE